MSDPLPTPTRCSESEISANKNISSGVSAVLFAILSAPATYKLTSGIFLSITGSPLADDDGCPNVMGLVAHGLVYTGLVRLLMDHLPKCDLNKPYNNRDKWMASLMGGALFILVSSPFTYSLTNSLVVSIAGSQYNIADDNGCPQLSGLVIHTLVFGLVVRLLMRN
jgi:hypothetical protein